MPLGFNVGRLLRGHSRQWVITPYKSKQLRAHNTHTKHNEAGEDPPGSPRRTHLGGF